MTKDGFTLNQFRADTFNCEQQVVPLYGGYMNMEREEITAARQDLFRCMTTKGYREATPEEMKSKSSPYFKSTPLPGGRLFK